MRRLIAELNAPAPAAPPPPAPADGNEPTPPPAPAADPTPDAPLADPTAEPAPDPAPEPAPDSAPGVDPKAAPTPIEPDDDDPDTPDEVTPITGNRARVRLGKTDQLGRLAVALKSRNRDWTLDQAMDAARKQLGIKPEGAAPAPVKGPYDDLPQTMEAVDAHITTLEDQRAEKLKSLEFDEVARIDKELRRSDRHRSNLERQEVTQASETHNRYNQEYDQSEARAVEHYPDAGKPESDFGKRMVEIEASLKELDDPLYHDAQKPLRIAQMVAKEMGIAPRKKGQSPAPASQPAAAPVPKPAVPAPKGNLVPSGGSRSTPPPAKPAVDERVTKVSNIEDLRKLQRELGIKAF